jgi:hypothetical protein
MTVEFPPDPALTFRKKKNGIISDPAPKANEKNIVVSAFEL